MPSRKAATAHKSAPVSKLYAGNERRDERLSDVEAGLESHEAVCAERQGNIIERLKKVETLPEMVAVMAESVRSLTTKVEDNNEALHARLSRHEHLMAWAVGAVLTAMASVIGALVLMVFHHA